MKFTEQERDFLKQEFADLCHAAINSMITAGSFVRSIDRIEAIVSERITPEPGSKSRERIVLERLLDKIKEAQSQGSNYAIENDDVVAIALVLSIKTPSAPITPEPGESGQSASAKDFLSKQALSGKIEHEGVGQYSMTFDVDKLASILTTYASHVCADKEREIEYTKTGASAIINMKQAEIEAYLRDIDRLNESLTVMVNMNAELEKELEYAKIR